jgi:hypothetical protein
MTECCKKELNLAMTPQDLVKHEGSRDKLLAVGRAVPVGDQQLIARRHSGVPRAEFLLDSFLCGTRLHVTYPPG